MQRRTMVAAVIIVGCLAILLGAGAYWALRCFPESSLLARIAVTAIQDTLGSGVHVAKVRLSFPNMLTLYDVKVLDGPLPGALLLDARPTDPPSNRSGSRLGARGHEDGKDGLGGNGMGVGRGISDGMGRLSEIALAAEPRRGRSPIFKAREVRVELDLVGLLLHRGQAASAVEVVTLDRPELTLVRDDSGGWNIDALSRGFVPGRPGVRGVDSKVVIRDGTVRIGGLPGASAIDEITAVDGVISLRDGGVKIEKVSGLVGSGGAEFSLSGRVGGGRAGYDIEGSFRGLPASGAAAALKLVTGATVPQLDMMGQARLDATLHINSDGKAVSYSGAASLPGQAAKGEGTPNAGSALKKGEEPGKNGAGPSKSGAGLSSGAGSGKNDAGPGKDLGLSNLIPRSFTFAVGSGKGRQEIQVFLDELTGLNLSKLEFEGRLDIGGKEPGVKPPAGPSFYRGTLAIKNGSVKARAVGPSIKGRVECKANGDMTFEVRAGETARYKGAVNLTAGTGSLLYTSPGGGVAGGGMATGGAATSGASGGGAAAGGAAGGAGTPAGTIEARGAVGGSVAFDTGDDGVLTFSGNVSVSGWKVDAAGLAAALDKATGVLDGEVKFDGKTRVDGGVMSLASPGGKSKAAVGNGKPPGDKGKIMEAQYQGSFTLANGSVAVGGIMKGLKSFSGTVNARVDYKGNMSRLASGEMAGATEYSGTITLPSGDMSFSDASMGIESIAGKVKGDGSFSGKTTAGPFGFDPKSIGYKGRIVLEGAEVKVIGGPLAPLGPIGGKADGEITFEAKAGELPTYKGVIQLADGSLAVAPLLKRPVTGLSTTVVFDESVIRIREAKGYLGASPMTVAGDIWIGSRPRLELTLSSPALDLSAIEAGALIPGLSSLEGAAHVDLTVGGYPGSLVYDGVVKVTNGALSYSAPPHSTPDRSVPPHSTPAHGTPPYGGVNLPLSDISASFLLDNGNVEIKGFRGHMAGAVVTAGGRISDLGKEPFLGLKVNIDGFPAPDLGRLVPGLGGILQPSSKSRAPADASGQIASGKIAGGSLNLALNVSGRLHDPVAHGNFSLSRAGIAGIAASDIAGNIAYRRGTLGIYQFAAHVAGGELKGDARINLWAKEAGGSSISGLRASASFDGVDIGPLATSGPAIIRWLEGLSGKLGGRVIVLSDGSDINSTGTLTLGPGSFRGMAFDSIEARMRLKGGTIYLDGVRGRGGSASFSALGTVDISRRSLNLDVSAKGVDVKTLATTLIGAKGEPVTGTGEFVGTISGPLDSAGFTGLVELRDGTILGQKFFGASGYLTVGPRGLSAEKVKVMAEGGTYAASGRLQGDKVDVDISVQEADMRGLARMAGISLDFEGSVRGRIRVAGPLKEPGVSGELRLDSGRVGGLPVERANLAFETAGGKIHLRRLDAQVAGGNMTASGSIQPGKEIDIDVAAEGLSLKNLAARAPAFREMPGLAGSLSGSAEFHGKVGGTLKNPSVKGRLTAGKFGVYGASFTGASGALSFEKGRVEVSPLVISDSHGKVTLTGYVGPGGARDIGLEAIATGLDAGGIAALLSRGRLASLRGTTSGAVSIKDGVISVKSLRVDQQAGHMAASGAYNPRGAVDLEIVTKSLDAGALLKAAGLKDAEGFLDMKATIKGRSQTPTATFFVDLRNGNVGQVYFDEFRGEINYRDGGLTIKDAVLAQGAHRARVRGSLPIPGKYLALLGITPPAHVPDMDMALEMDQASLMLLALVSDDIEWARGFASVDLRLTGSLDKPEIRGSVRASGGEIKYRPLADAITDIAGDLEFRGDQVLVHALRGRIRGGGLSAQGRVGLAGVRPSYMDVSVAANELPVISSFIAAVADGRLRVRGPAGLPTMSGDIALKKAEINPFALRAPAAKVPFDARLDLELNLGSDARLSTKDLDVGISGRLHIGGSLSEPAASGTITARKGTFIYFGTEFALTDGRAEFMEFNGLVPDLEIHGETRVNGTKVMLTLAGKPESLTMRLSSDPPMRQEEIVALLNYPAALTRVLSGDVEGAVKDEILRIIDQELRLQVVGSVERALRQALSLDDVKLERDDANKLTLRLGKYVVDNLYISYNAPLSPEAKGALKLEYLFSPGIILSSRFEDQGHYSLGLEARLRF